MKAFLNILPPDKKKSLRQMRLYKSVIRQEGIILLLLLFLGVLLGGIWGQLRYQYYELQKAGDTVQAVQKNREAALTEYEKTFEQTEKMLRSVDTLFADQDRWSWVFRLMGDVLSDEVVVERIELQEDMVLFEGIAQSREILLSVEQTFKGQECFSEVSIPLSHLAQKENIEFKMTITLSEACLHTMH